ncbi:MAG: prolyl-tRNA synthetase [Parcubacteria bacterium C7867-005]|nr:MAG: prolyl-tRNA synthetase [Parcubacteria bacterium C7867-005]
MRQSQFFTKTRKEAPADEVSKNAQLLIRGGFINKEMSGVYDFLPLGLRVLNKIINIIRDEMNMIGGQEIFMSALQRKELWERTDRWSDEKVDNWFKTNLKDGAELGLAFTHEEPISNMLEQFVSSHKDLPFSVYQFQTKFRNETRAKSGIMRTREFIMKDLYSFTKDEVEHLEFYEKAKKAYLNIFKTVGLGDMTYITTASGGSFSEFSHEFQTLCDAGEDIIYITDENKKEALNKELGMDVATQEEKAVEIGNIFTLGTKFSDGYLTYKDEAGENKPVFMGSYGIGPARLMGTIVEVLSDKDGIVWPKSVAPFRAHILSLGQGENVLKLAEETYKTLVDKGVEVLFDDRDVRAGEKFADADLIGIPTRVVVSEKTIESNMFETKDRATGEVKSFSLDHLISELQR